MFFFFQCLTEDGQKVSKHVGLSYVYVIVTNYTSVTGIHTVISPVLHGTWKWPPRAGLGAGEIIFWAPSMGGPAKNLYTGSRRLTVSCRVTWGWSESVNLYYQERQTDRQKHVQHNRIPVICTGILPSPVSTERG